LKVFISYSWQDASLRRAIVGDLRSIDGIEILYDSKNISPSQEIHLSISELIESSDVVIAILTPSSLASKEVIDELTRSNERKKNIIPLLDESINQALPKLLCKDTVKFSIYRIKNTTKNS
jgi:hypothetical protein